MHLRPPHLSDIDRLLCGREPDDDRLVVLLPLVRSLRRAAELTPPRSRALRVATEAAGLSSAARASRNAATPTRADRPALSRPRLRLTGALLVLVVMLSASVGVASAANSAIPGETLYPLDCALEDLGLGNGGITERLSEAGLLVKSGQLGPGLVLVADALAHNAGTGGASQAANALRDAAGKMLDNGSARSAELRTRVAARLLDLAARHLTADQVDQAVVSLALDLDGDDGERTGDPERSNGKGNGGPERDKTTTTTKVKTK